MEKLKEPKNFQNPWHQFQFLLNSAFMAISFVLFCFVLTWSIHIFHYFCVLFEWFLLSDVFLFFAVHHFNNLSHCMFVSVHHPSSYRRTHIQLSNGFDHYSPASSPYLHNNGGSLGSVSGTAFPFFPPSSSSSTSSSCPTRSWSRPTSALLPDYPHYCTMGSPMVPSSRVPSWKVCPSP